ncbi:hypothetical protein HUG15_05095 [Salicibibacter cibarius]|uniref:Uncharacterized protein n=1 Tax=Salicibibacter cibarius TaxID=2743000 RepID=A0A7T6Z1A6_9BACI|nr:hypothetical protein [Salicibibacter cibarius]QQK75037.1 hypothetical protein HUG15_05095 [Salicibibacter cibarius]
MSKEHTLFCDEFPEDKPIQLGLTGTKAMLSFSVPGNYDKQFSFSFKKEKIPLCF